MTLEPAIRDDVLAAVPSLRGFAHLLCLNVEQAETVECKSTQIAQTKCDDFYRALSELRPAWREPLILIEAAGLTFEEAAQVCGCRVEMMKSRVNRARTELALHLAIEGPTDFANEPVLVAISECGGR
jgi:DNA-directed RNA polymerase specialized sigma24 family protein